MKFKNNACARDHTDDNCHKDLESHGTRNKHVITFRSSRQHESNVCAEALLPNTPFFFTRKWFSLFQKRMCPSPHVMIPPSVSKQQPRTFQSWTRVACNAIGRFRFSVVSHSILAISRLVPYFRSRDAYRVLLL